MSDYDPLEAHLAHLNGPSVTMSLSEIEYVLGRRLPISARRHRAFWANQREDANRPWARAWQRPGWCVARGGVEWSGTEIVAVRFERVVLSVGQSTEGAAAPPPKVEDADEVVEVRPRATPHHASTSPRLLIVSTCSGRKLVEQPAGLRREDFADPARLADRERQLARWSHPALEMYQGCEHTMVTRAVTALRVTLGEEGVRHRIISAGYGLISPDRPIAPYDVSFNDMDAGEVVPWATRIGIPTDLNLELESADLAILLLGTRYLWAAQPRRLSPRHRQRLIFVAAPSQAHRIGTRHDVTLVAAGADDAARRGTDNYKHKGWLIERFAEGLTTRDLVVLEALIEDASSRTFLEIAGTT